MALYECADCGKKFHTRRLRRNHDCPGDEEEDEEELPEFDELVEEEDEEEETDGEHVCDECGEVFDTPQGLSGHQSAH